MYLLSFALFILLLAVAIPQNSLATPILPSNYDLHNATAPSVIQPRADWDRIAAEIRADTELIDALNEIGTDCEDDMLILGVETLKQPMLEKGYTRQGPFVFYTSGMAEAAMSWAPSYFQEKDPERWEDTPQEDWKYGIWLRAAHQFPRAMHKRTQKLPTAVGKLLEGYEFQRPIKAWTSDIGQKNEVQAVAETVEGDVYIVVPAHENPSNDVNGWDTVSAWGGWEFPAIAQNNNVDALYRIDPTNQDTPVKIWKKGDPRPEQNPKGNKKDITFNGNFGDWFKEKSETVLPIQRKLKSLMS